MLLVGVQGRRRCLVLDSPPLLYPMSSVVCEGLVALSFVHGEICLLASDFSDASEAFSAGEKAGLSLSILNSSSFFTETCFAATTRRRRYQKMNAMRATAKAIMATTMPAMSPMLLLKKYKSTLHGKLHDYKLPLV